MKSLQESFEEFECFKKSGGCDIVKNNCNEIYDFLCEPKKYYCTRHDQKTVIKSCPECDMENFNDQQEQFFRK